MDVPPVDDLEPGFGGMPVLASERAGRDICVEIANALAAVTGAELGRRVVRSLEAIVAVLGADYGVLVEYGPGSKVQSVTSTLGTPSVLTERAPTPMWESGLASGEAVVTLADDPARARPSESDFLRAASVSGAIVVPLGGPAPRGTLTLYFQSRPVPPNVAVNDARIASFLLIDAIARRRSDDAAAAAEARATAFVEHLEDVVALVRSRDGIIIAVNPAVERVFGIPRQDLLGQPIATQLAPCDPDTLEPVPPDRRASWLVMSGAAASITQTFAHRRADGRWAWARQVVEPVEVGGEAHVVVTVTDMTAQHEAARLRERSALHDPITGIPTRRLLDVRVAGLADAARSGDAHLAALHISLDNFGSVVDRLGHDQADELLATVVRDLSRTLSPGEVVARLASDELGVLATVTDHDAARRLLQGALGVVAKPVRNREDMVVLTAFGGAALGTPPEAEAGVLFRRASAACRDARQRGDRLGTVWDASTEYDDPSAAPPGASLAQALERNELVLHYQPIIRLSDRTIVGAEALLRGRHPERGLLPPAAFLDLAESSGLIVPIGEWVLGEACTVFASAHPGLTVAVNVSVRQLGHGLTGAVRGLLNRSAIQPDRLYMELTESVVASSTEHLVSDLNTIRALGVQVGLDDFGTGFSPLTHLQDLHLDFLKIDRSFVGECADRASRGYAIVDAILALAHQLDLATVAEGVEDEACAASLLERGADLVQGYLFGRPVPLEDFTALVDQRRHSGIVARRRSGSRGGGAAAPSGPTAATPPRAVAPRPPSAGRPPSDVLIDEPRLVAPKLTPPPERSVELRRNGLLERLRGCHEPILLVSAPAGDGKSTLVAQWVRELAQPVAWLSVDPEDGDLRRFWLHLATAVQRAGPQAADRSLAATTVDHDVMASIVPLVLEQLARSPMVIVLDDYHLVRSDAIDESVAMLGDRLPPGCRLIIATRHDPGLPLSRWRGRGMLAELREADLRLSTDEAREFLTGSLGLSIPRGDADILAQRTEGWIGCLYLAARAMERSDDPHRFVQAFRGSQRSVLGYLMDEVLGGLDPDSLRLLRHLSVVERFTPGLADAISHGSGSAARLHELEQTNLLLIPLDDTGEWYRLHHLLRDALLFELRNGEPHRESLLHAAAAEWYSRAGYFEEALRHADASGDPELGREMLRRHWLLLALSAQSAVVLERIDRFDAIDLEDPELAFAAAYRAVEQDRPQQATALLDTVVSRGAGVPFQIGLPNGVVAATLLRAHYPFEGVSVSSSAAKRLLDLFPVRPPLFDAFALVAAGLERWNAGDDACIDLLERAVALDVPLLNIRAAGFLANLLLDVDRESYARALDATSRAQALVSSLGMAGGRRASLADLAGARISARAGDADTARRLLASAVEEAEVDFRYDLRLYVLARAIPALARLGDADASADAARQAAGLLARHPDAGRAGAIARQALGRLHPRSLGTLAVEPLSERERRVLRLLVATGLSQPEMASELGVTLNTMKTHVKAVYRKLGVASRDEARTRAQDLGLA